jgi:hypothetical protein
VAKQNLTILIKLPKNFRKKEGRYLPLLYWRFFYVKSSMTSNYDANKGYKSAVYHSILAGSGD